MQNCCPIPEIKLYSKKEAVLIEFRRFPHIEFLIRNAINKLGSDWSFTIVCGNLNYKMMFSICNNISKNIKIVKTNYDNLDIPKYNIFLKSLDFWNLIEGEKILIYQEDSFIFGKNLDEYMSYDFIGAPWEKSILPISVGNGGISLRTKQIMIDIINIVNSEDINKENEEISEDTFFSKHMQRLNIGKIADWDTAFDFSSETIYSENSFAGHQFWLSDPFWKTRMYNSIYEYISV